MDGSNKENRREGGIGEGSKQTIKAITIQRKHTTKKEEIRIQLESGYKERLKNGSPKFVPVERDKNRENLGTGKNKTKRNLQEDEIRPKMSKKTVKSD